MQKFNIPSLSIRRINNFTGRFLVTVLFSTFSIIACFSQVCPPNIDFETGTFNNWTCYTGYVAAVGSQNVINLSPSGGPVPNQHTMYTAGQANERDPYGGFPVNCPNGSGHSIKLGNESAGGQAEGISYEFTIPAGQNEYSLIYHYAVVFQDPNHREFQQPRLEIEATNVTDNEVIYCSSFTFFPNGSLLPGFFISPIQVDTTNVWCKDWTAVSINLNGNAGKTIRLFFKTADCTFIRHFGYAYIDVNSECSSEFIGATYCPDDTAIQVTAPFGYESYNWFTGDFSQQLGFLQTIKLSPPPPANSFIAVEIIPFNGYGCKDTLYALLIDSLTVKANAGKDTLSCNGSTVPIGVIPTPGIVYRWTPIAGLSDPNIANPRAGPFITTQYILKASSFGGGCVSYDTVTVNASVIDTAIFLVGKEAFCISNNDSAILKVDPNNSIQWFKDNKAINGAIKSDYKVLQSGTYYAYMVNNMGCSINSSSKKILIEVPRPGINYPVQNAVVNYPLNLQARNFGTSVLWKPSKYLNNPTILNPVFKGTEEIVYKIEITTAGGCLTVDTQLVKVFKEIKFYVPTAFTPNNDGLNDYLKPTQAGIKELRFFRIYHRWGQLLFDLNANPRGWDGKINSIAQPAQVVVWVAEGIGYDNKVYKQNGSCLLIR